MNKPIYRTILPVLLIVLQISPGFAQKKDTCIIQVYYKVRHQIDSLDVNSTQDYGAVLFIGKKLSRYTSVNKLLNDSLMSEASARLDANSNEGITIPYTPGRKRITIYESMDLYKENSKNMFFEIDAIAMNKFLIEDSITAIKWEIKADTKEVMGLQCQKATANYKGRFWEAWFCNSVPVPQGPWKLGGLPGLIVEAADASNKISFHLAGMSSSAGKRIIEMPEGGRKVSRTVFEENIKAYAADPLSYLSTSLGGSLSDMHISNQTPGSAPARIKVPNNPIERVP